MTNEKLVYLVSPVRNVTEDQAEAIAEHAARLKAEGARVFNPVVDAPQEDRTGFNIVMAELNFMHRASLEGGRIDILWNAGGTPSEGSRVDLGMAIALGLEFNLVTIFNDDRQSGTQMGLQLIREIAARDIEHSPFLREIMATIEEIRSLEEVTIDWDIEMSGLEQEWQRVYLGLALGCMALNPKLKIKMGKLTGIDPVEKKSYPKVIAEIETMQEV